jgi:hypothetical protein
MTITPEQWDLAKLNIELAHIAMVRLGLYPEEAVRRVALGYLEIARNALLEPVTDEMRAG